MGGPYMKPTHVKPVKLLAGILYSEQTKLVKAFQYLEEQFGSIDYKSPTFDFNVTDYYNAEMGSPIWRCFIAFATLINPEDLPDIKLQTNTIEDRLSENQRRKINIDSGYLDYDKVVLASAKYNGQKIYMGKGIYADLTLYYTKGQFRPYPWSFPDFKESQYQNAFTEMRQIYKTQINKLI